MAGKSSKSGNWSPGPVTTKYRASGKNRDFYTSENAPGLNPYATGGTVVDAGDGYVYHIFISDGTFTVTSPPTIINSVEYLIVAGGGGAGPQTIGGGGGGGGGYVFGSIGVSNTPGAYPIVIGAGGPSTPGAPGTPRNGSPSTAFGLTAAGGGGGASYSGSPAVGGVGGSGGSGGGGQGGIVTPTPGGPGDIPPTIPRQGFSGNSGGPATGGSGGGGGAGGLGYPFAGAPNIGGARGPGRIEPNFPTSILGLAIPTANYPSWYPLINLGGFASGGYGFPVPAPEQRTAVANTGYGGDGNASGNTGGSGIVCIKYMKPLEYSRATGGIIEPSTDPNHPGVWRHIFTSPGTFTITDPTLQWIDYLAVGGGGAGGGAPAPIGGAGGGAGGFVSSIHPSNTVAFYPSESHAWNPGYSAVTGEQMPVSAGPYPITIGTGGVAPSGNGTDTTIGAPGPAQIIAYGGGGGRSPSPLPSPLASGNPGGSGGGGAKQSVPGSSSGGSATPSGPISGSGTQGNPGGSTAFPTAVSIAAGGGAGAAGGVLAGGVGWYSVISPPAYGTPGPVAGRRYFAGGGGGSPSGAGGAGGGGVGQPATPRNGTANTGGGGGSGSSSAAGLTAGTGGSGIVIIQYPE